MNWYITKMVFQIINGSENDNQNQFDEQIRLLNADNAYEAFYKAQKIGLQEEESFLNNNLQAVKWKFIAVKELQQIDDLKNGTELYYYIKEVDHPKLYIKGLKADELKLQEEFTNGLFAS